MLCLFTLNIDSTQTLLHVSSMSYGTVCRQLQFSDCSVPCTILYLTAVTFYARLATEALRYFD